MGVPGEHAIAYSLVGMAAFFTTAANAPITSLVLVVEFTMAGQMMFPLIIGVLVSYGTARLTKAQSMYHDSLAFGPRSTFDKPLAQVQLQDVARKDPPVVHPLDKFGTIAAMLIKNPAHPIFVTSPAGKYLGSVEAEDVAAFARNKELAQAVLAMDVLRNDMPTLPADMHLPEALGHFLPPPLRRIPGPGESGQRPSSGRRQQDGPLPGALRDHAERETAIRLRFSG